MYNDIYGEYIKNRMTNKGRKEEKIDTPIEFERIEVENTDNNEKDNKSYEYDLIVKNGRVVIPGERVVKTNVFIKKGKIVLLGNDETISAKEVIDAEGKYVTPGIVDPHVHYGIYNSLDLDLETETSSALLGGITTSGFFIGSDGNSHLKRFPEIEYAVNEKSSIDIIPHLVIDCETQLNELKDYVEHLGITSFKVYMNGIPGMIPEVDDGFILDVFKELKKLRSMNDKITLCIHTENNDIVQRNIERIKKEKGDAADIVDWTDTHPPMAEEEAVMRVAFFAEKFEMPIYIVHISSKDAIKRLEQIKKSNKFVNVETTSPYLSVNKYSIDNSLIKMEPPFRGAEDQKELWEALCSGVVDSVGTDNVTLTTK
ncbi:MAG: amidohydrolase family protein, partial [Bacillota bacterium]|nr:amidohydrolase family protein [Bacillota bacterium]